jgi:uncharacterized RDD family membrane protein YckC
MKIVRWLAAHGWRFVGSVVRFTAGFIARPMANIIAAIAPNAVAPFRPESVRAVRTTDSLRLDNYFLIFYFLVFSTSSLSWLFARSEILCEGHVVSGLHCPLCDQPVKAGRCEHLYESDVCQPCYLRFQKRREFAFLIDCYITFALILIPYLIWGSTGLPEPLATPIIAVLYMVGLIGFLMGDVLIVGICLVALEEGISISGFGWEEVYLLFGRFIQFPLMMALRDGYHGISPGKYIMGLQSVDSRTHQPIDWQQSLQRNLWFFAMCIPFGILTRSITNGLRIGDSKANTRVIDLRHLGNAVFSDKPFCNQCRYDLTGNTSGVCPECGHAIVQYEAAEEAEALAEH